MKRQIRDLVVSKETCIPWLAANLIAVLVVWSLSLEASADANTASMIHQNQPIQKRLTGQYFLNNTKHASITEREAAIGRTILLGHFPAYLLEFKPVSFHDGKNTLVVMVSPDYLAIGDDNDFVRMPMGLDTALAIAQRFDCILPTEKMVDAIYSQASIKIEAHYLAPSHKMVSNDYYHSHHRWIQDQLFDSFYQDHLLAGHKKDVVLSKKLIDQKARVAIYGWQRIRDRSPTQPLSTWHHRSYADYSHGIRLVSRFAWLNGQTRDLHELINDPEFAHLISNEGPFSIKSIITPLTDRFATAAH